MRHSFYSPQDPVVNGSLQSDFLLGTARKEWLFGSDGNDLIFADAGDDILYGGLGEDLLLGWTGDDLLVGQSGDDILAGGAGNDILSGEAGADTLIGGVGADQFALIKSPGSVDAIIDFNSLEGDKIAVFGLSFGASSLSEFVYDTYSGGVLLNQVEIICLQPDLNFVPQIDIILV